MRGLSVSSKFQIVIPKSIVESAGLRPGQQVQVIAYGDRIELLPLRRAVDLRGFLEGIDTSITRESDRT